MHNEGPEATAAGNAGALTRLLRGMPAFWTLLLFYAAYVAAGTLCDGLSLIPGVSIIFWPPVGILIATLLLNPRPSWPWWIAAGCAAELTCNALLWGNPIQYAIIYYAGNALEALTAAWLIGRFAPKPFRFETIEQVVAFLALAAGIAPTVSATVIATADAFRGKHLFTTAWPLVWLGDATGMLVSAPLTFVVVQAWRERGNIPTARMLEAGVATGLMLAISILSLYGSLPTVYLSLPVLLWIAVRFGLKGAAAAALGLLTLASGSFTAAGLGQFAASAEDPYFNVIRFHVFLAVSAISALFVAALSQQRKVAAQALEAVNRDLERRVVEQTEGLRENEARFRAFVMASSDVIYRMSADWSEMRFLDGRDFIPDTPEPTRSWVDKYIHPDDQAFVLDAIRRAVAAKTTFNLEHRVLRVDGTLGWTHSRAIPMLDADGEIVEWFGAAGDVTERRIAQEKLRESEERFRVAAQGARVGTWETDLATGRNIWSAETKSLIGGEDAGFDADDWLAAVHPDDRDAVAEAWRMAIEEGYPYEVEFRGIRPAADGGERWLLSRGSIERDTAGSSVRGAGVLLDITELRRVRSKLGEQSAQLRLVTDAMPALISYVDADRRYQFINVEYEKWFGADQGETIGRTVSEVLGEDAHKEVEPYLQRVFAGEDVQFEAHIHYRKAGWKWVEAHYIPDLTSDGAVRGFYGLVLDITARKELEARTREQFEELESIYASVPVGLAVIDKDLRFVRVNEWLADLNGRSAADHAGRPVSEVVPVLADQARQILQKVVETGEPVRDVVIEGETSVQPGVQRAWREIWSPVKDEQGEVVAVSVVVEDVTESMWAESLISEQNRLFEMIAVGRSLETILTELTAVIDRLQPRTRSAVLVADRTRSEFEAAYAANIPDSYISPLKGVKIETNPVGTCCEAVHKGIAVTSTDVASDPRWTEKWRGLCLAHGIRACHSEPILGEDGRPVGTVVLAFDSPREPDDRGLRLVRLGAQVAGVAIERERAEQDLRASESEYRTLFGSIDEGYCVVEVICDDEDRPVDYRFVQINPAFAVNTGLPVDSVGRTARELVPGLEDHWVEVYGRVALTGEPIRFENNSDPMGRWFDVYALRVGEPEQRRVGILFNDITERKRREANLALLADIATGLSQDVTADHIIRSVGERLSRHLGISGCLFAEVEEAADKVRVESAWAASGPRKLVGEYRLSDFVTPAFRKAARLGEPIVSPDTGSDQRVDAEAYAAYGIGAFVSVPFKRAGQWKYLFTVNSAEAREWRDDEVELIKEVTNRLFPRIDRARAEAALRVSEERLRLATQAAEIYTWEYDPSTGISHYSPNVRSVLGFELPTNTGSANLFIHPHDRERVMGEFAACLEGHPVRSEYRFLDPATGETTWVATHGVLLPANGRPARAVGITQNITHRKLNEVRIRESEERQAFMLRLADELGPLVDPLEIQSAAARALGEQLGANRAYYIEVEPDGEHVVCAADYTNGVPSAAGRYLLDAFGPTLRRDYQSGKVLVVTDTFGDERIPPALRDAWASIGIRAQVAVPLVKNGRFVAALGVDQNAPRRWTDGEIALVREVAERTWAAVERAYAEAAMRESEERYRAVVESQSEMICRFRLEGTFLFVNGVYASMMGRTVDELIGTSFWDCIPESEHPGVRAMLESLSPDHPEVRIENRLETVNGEIWTLWTNRALAFDEEGRAIEAQSTGIDISELKETEAKLRESEERFRNMADNAPVMIWMTEPDGYCTYLSQSWYDFTGQTPEEGLGYGWLKATHPDDAKMAEDIFRASNAKCEPFRAEYRLRSKDGEYRWAIDSAQPRFSESGVYLGYIGSVIDIHERKEAEEQRRRDRERFDIVRDGAEVGFWFCDLPFDELIWDNRVKEHFWLPPGARVTIDTFYDRIHPDDRERTRQAIAASNRNKTQYDIEYRTVDPASGREKWIRAIGRTFYDRQGEPIRFDGVTLDITERKLVEDALRGSEELLASTFSGVEAAITISEVIDGGREFRFLGANRACAEWTGIPADDWIGKRPHEFLPESTAESVTGRYRAAVIEGRAMDYEEMVTVPAGDIWALTTVTPLRDDHGGITRVVATSVNITKRKEAETALQTSEERHRGLVNQTVAGIAEVDLTGRFVTANDRYCEVTGYTREELLGMSMQEITHPDDLHVNLAQFKNLSADGTPFEIEKRYVRKDGSTVWVHNSVSAICDEKGRPKSIAAVSIDITERKRAEEALRSQTELLRGITESTPDLIYAKDASGRMIMANKATLRVIGQTEETAIGRIDSELYDPLEADLIMANDRRVMQSGRTETIEETVTTDGDTRTYLTTKNPLRDAEGRVIGVVGVSHDITALKRAEVALRESETRQRLALEAGNMGAWTMPMDGGPCWADERTLALFDIPLREWTGDSALIRARRLPEDQDEVNRALARAIAERSTWRSEFRVRRGDGSIRWLAGVGRIEFGPRGEPMMMRGINFDITERKQAEEELRSYHEILEATVRERTSELAEANQELKKENRQRRLVEVERQRLLGQLVAAQEQERRRIAQDLHDHLGQQLTALNLKLELALQAAASGAADHLHDAKAIMRQIDDDVDALAWQLRPAILDDDGFLPALRNYVEDWSRRCGIPAELWADEHFEDRNGLSPEAETNLYRITQEALNNVAKYASAERVEVLLNKRGDSVVLTVQDDGEGFDVNAAAARTEKSMGLIGMRERAGLVGGTFQIESAPGEGTAVYVRVPFADGHDEPILAAGQ